MNDDIKLMIQIYKTYDVDWLGCEIKSESDLTRHHIVKKENGGENGISNYALLTKSSHIFLHYLEDNYYYAYNELNSLFLELNMSVSAPTKEYYEKVRSIVKKVRKSIKNKKRTIRRK